MIMDFNTIYTSTEGSFMYNSTLDIAANYTTPEVADQSVYKLLEKQKEIIETLQEDVKYIKQVNSDNDIIIANILSQLNKLIGN